MQKIATRVFIYSSITFGIIGLIMVLTLSGNDNGHPSVFNEVIQRLLMANVFVILPSFALSVAAKYLKK